MDILSRIINKKNEPDSKLIHAISHKISDFFDTYKASKKIDGYTTEKVDIDEKYADILVMREQIYLLVRKKADLLLKAEDEFNPEILNDQNRNDIFSVTKVSDDESLELFLAYSIFFYLDNIHFYKRLSIGLDFEFTERKIALCQVAFYPARRYKYIFVFDPNSLTPYQTNIIIRTIFTSNIIRITHGSDSLDIPYIFEQLLNKDSGKIINFTKTNIDTRFLCEYHKIYNSLSNKKCSIYDALLYFKIITSEKYDELTKINASMGPVQDVQWNLTKMSSYHLKYVLYDVLFLRKFLIGIYDQSKKENHLHSQLKLIPLIMRLIYYDKYELTNIIATTKLLVNPINNYIVESLDGHVKKTLITVFNEIIDDIVIPEYEFKISKFLEINYLRTPLFFLYKRIVYSIMTQKYKIYMDKKNRFKNKLTFHEIFPELKKLYLSKLIDFFEKVESQAKILIMKNIG